ARRSVPSKVTSTKRFARQLQISRPNTNLRSVSQITYRGAIALAAIPSMYVIRLRVTRSALK
ncbi:hypothetical protein, partial [Rubripirellula obstinata]|uniref:hypothetical protein n=1 Tax=Rubripirellula obstinata TaxID=406547 RepID=UPI001EE3FFC9